MDYEKNVLYDLQHLSNLLNPGEFDLKSQFMLKKSHYT